MTVRSSANSKIVSNLSQVCQTDVRATLLAPFTSSKGRFHNILLYPCVESKEGVVMFSGKVVKWNKYGIKQDRSLVITNLNVYNFKKKSLRRVVPI